jgi:hypothetical protein
MSMCSLHYSYRLKAHGSTFVVEIDWLLFIWLKLYVWEDRPLKVPRWILSYFMFTILSCWCFGWRDSRPSIQKLDFHYGLLASEKPKLQNVWDSYVIFLELKIVLRNKQRIKDIYDIWRSVCKFLWNVQLCLRLKSVRSGRTPVMSWWW